MKHATKEIRELAVSLRKSGKYTIPQIAEIVGYHPNSIKAWLKADREGRPQVPRKRGCPPKILNPDDIIRLKELIDTGKCHTLEECVKELGKASISTIHRTMNELGYSFKKKRYLPAKEIAQR